MLDLKMPRVDGLEVLKALKEHAELRSIPVVVLSASERSEDVDSSYRLGANSFVTKPTAVGAFSDGLIGIRKFWTEVATLPEPPG
jgi:CheY-like chemotaxis protein